MKKLLFLVGTSGSGKSTLERALVEKRPDKFKKIVSVVTRPPREGEVDGYDYHFITKEQFDGLRKTGCILQETFFHDTYYGSTRVEYMCDQEYGILVAVPDSIAQFLPVFNRKFPHIATKMIFFDISPEKIRENLIKRGDSEEQDDDRERHEAHA